MAADPDAGVRELILALRDLPTDQAGDALKTLTRSWNSQDRWYRTLGLALETRGRPTSPASPTAICTGYSRSMSRERPGAWPCRLVPGRSQRGVPCRWRRARRPRLGKTLGLAWRLHRPEILPFLGRVPSLAGFERNKRPTTS
ncbi:MAG: hypothetical protein WKF75_16175 [Singulisphaera sp.]